MPKKKTNHISNWRDYNKALVNRGNLMVWLSPQLCSSWLSVTTTKRRGRPTLYADVAIDFCLTIKVLFKLPLRATQGLVQSIFQMMKIPLPVPDYTLLCKRQTTLALKVVKQQRTSKAMHLVVDSTGLKLYGEGEWKVKQHGQDKRRTWLKLHLAIDEASHAIEAVMVTSEQVHDAEVLPELLQAVDGPIHQVTADGAYDSHGCYQAASNLGAKPCFPPRVNAARHRPCDEAWRLRNHALSQVQYHDVKHWKKKNNYHRRSVAETAIFRFKQLLGTHVSARTSQRQATEIGIKCSIINQFNQLGMPQYNTN